MLGVVDEWSNQFRNALLAGVNTGTRGDVDTGAAQQRFKRAETLQYIGLAADVAHGSNTPNLAVHRPVRCAESRS